MATKHTDYLTEYQANRAKEERKFFISNCVCGFMMVIAVLALITY